MKERTLGQQVGTHFLDLELFTGFATYLTGLVLVPDS